MSASAVLRGHPSGGLSGVTPVTRADVAASRAARPRPGTEVISTQPWESLVDEAEVRMKTEANEATREYERRIKQAGKILDTADAIAREQRSRLEAAAWSTWSVLMEDAAKAADAVLNPALEAYRKEVAKAHDEWAGVMHTAEQTYNKMLDDAERGVRVTTFPERPARKTRPAHPEISTGVTVPPLQ